MNPKPPYAPPTRPASICSPCALARGAEWPQGHLATFWNGECQFCFQQAACCCTTDWNWPGLDRLRSRREF